MNDWGRSVLEQYKAEVKNVRKGRGALLCETAEKEILILQEYRGSLSHLKEESEILRFLTERGGMYVDFYIKNKEGELYSQNYEGKKYVLKKWYDYPECNVNSYSEIGIAVRTLAKLHMLLKRSDYRIKEDTSDGSDTDDDTIAARKDRQTEESSLLEEYEKHNRELKRIRTYIKNKKRKTEFELCAGKSFSYMYEEAEEALERLKKSQYTALDKKARDLKQICHGSYHHHNVLIKGVNTAVINFQHFRIGIPIFDLYQFMRKVLEKHNWNTEIGRRMLEDYSRILPISKEEKEILYAIFLYPEKYWKQMNFYYNNSKVWIPQRSTEKLQKAAQQSQARLHFLKVLE